MAQIIHRRGSWYSDFRSNGRRIRRPLSKDRREAQIELGRLMEAMRAERSGKAAKDISWKNFRAKYLEYCKSKKASSAKRDLAAISVLEQEFPIHRLAQITPELLDTFKARRLANGKGKPTVARDVSAIKALMHKAEGWGYIHKQAWATVKKLKLAKKKLYYHTVKELGRLISECHGHWKTAVLLGARAGLRRGEIQTLTWEDVDFVKNRIHIVAKSIDGVLWEPKDYEQRFIPMVSDLREHLSEVAKKAKNRWVVVELNGERPSLAVMTAYIRKRAKKAKVRGSIHILRHTFASHLVQNGYSLKRVKDWLGHADMKTTEIYAELAEEDFEGSAIKLPRVRLHH